MRKKFLLIPLFLMILAGCTQPKSENGDGAVVDSSDSEMETSQIENGDALKSSYEKLTEAMKSGYHFEDSGSDGYLLSFNYTPQGDYTIINVDGEESHELTCGPDYTKVIEVAGVQYHMEEDVEGIKEACNDYYDHIMNTLENTLDNQNYYNQDESNVYGKNGEFYTISGLYSEGGEFEFGINQAGTEFYLEDGQGVLKITT